MVFKLFFLMIMFPFSLGRISYLPDYGITTNQIWLDDIDCQTTGSTPIPFLDQCGHAAWGSHDCRPDQIAKVRCNAEGKVIRFTRRYCICISSRLITEVNEWKLLLESS